MSVKEAQAKIDSREFSEWQAFYNIEPFGKEADDFRHSIICMLLDGIRHSFGQKEYRGKPEDYIYEHGKINDRRQVEDMHIWAETFAKVHNAKFKKDKQCQ